MTDHETVARFIFLRSQGWSFNRSETTNRIPSEDSSLPGTTGRSEYEKAGSRSISVNFGQIWAILGWV